MSILNNKKELIENLMLGKYPIEEATQVTDFLFMQLRGQNLELATKRCERILELRRSFNPY